MIQRIQSIYFLVSAFIFIAVFTFPLWTYSNGQGVYNMFVYSLKNIQSGVSLYTLLPLVILSALTAVLNIIALFTYKNRKKQMHICKINYLLIFGFMIVLTMYIIRMGNTLQTNGYPGFGLIMPFIGLTLVFMAHKAVKRDEDLVKSADRIR